jgi:adenine/guanine phosphoribosyltransferase-like PRPP-binding protein
VAPPDSSSPWILPTTGFWQGLEPLADWDGRFAPPWRHGVPVRVQVGLQTHVLLLPIRALPGSGDRAVASLIANQASLSVADMLTRAMGELAHGFAPDVVVGLPTLGLVFAPGVARALGHARWVPLGYSRKYWYDDALSTQVASITTPGPGKTLYLDPNQLPLLQGRRVLIVDDAVSSAQTLLQVWNLLERLGASVVGAVVAMRQGERWRAALGMERAQRVHGVFDSPLLRLGDDGWRPLQARDA